MKIEITNQQQGRFSTFVSFRADGVRHTALVCPDPAQSKVFAFGAQGDDCQTTHEIDSPEMLAAVAAGLRSPQ
jgi:hypothetical protein